MVELNKGKTTISRSKIEVKEDKAKRDRDWNKEKGGKAKTKRPQ